MADILIRGMEAMENVMIYAAEQRDQVGQPRKRAVMYNAVWWMAKAIYDLLKREIWRGKHG